MNDELKREFRLVAAEVLLSDDVDEGAERIEKIATDVAQRVRQVTEQGIATRVAIARSFDAWMARHHEDLLSDPDIMKRVQAREQTLMRAFPGMRDEERWERAANETRERYGTADQRVIRGMRQSRLGARFSGDTESYDFDTGASDPFDDDQDRAEAEERADRSAAIHSLQLANRGREVKLDKARYNEMELRRRQHANR